jgi:hypothetical protein
LTSTFATLGIHLDRGYVICQYLGKISQLDSEKALEDNIKSEQSMKKENEMRSAMVKVR